MIASGLRGGMVVLTVLGLVAPRSGVAAQITTPKTTKAAPKPAPTPAPAGKGTSTASPAAAPANAMPSTPVGPPRSWAAVTYVSGTTVYLEVGTKQGIKEGTVFTVVRAGQTIGELSASFVSSSRTACAITRSTGAISVGDSVAYVPVPVQPLPTTLTAAGSKPVVRASSRRSPVRGRVGLRYLTINQPGGSTLRQPSVDLRLDGSQIGGSAMGLAVDVRMQRTNVTGGSSSATSAPAGATRVYQAAFIRQRTPNGTRLAVGRQFATVLSPIGIFDGVALDMHGSRWSGGGLLGTMPDGGSFAPSAATTEAGLWLQRHSARGSASPWSATVGAIGSYNRGEIDREFAYLRGTLNTRVVSIYAAEEIDVNRGWKRQAEGSAATLTSTVITAQVTMSRALSVSGGLDSRRSVRLYRDFVNPEIAFDDALRQGQWGELSIRPSRHLRLSSDIRTSGGGSEGKSQAVTASFSATQLTRLGLGLRARSTQYSGAITEGRLSSVAVEVAPGSAVRLSLNTGVRTSAMPAAGLPATRLTWAGGDLDVAVGRSFYVMLSTYREAGTASASTQTYAAVTWRF